MARQEAHLNRGRLTFRHLFFFREVYNEKSRSSSTINLIILTASCAETTRCVLSTEKAAIH